MIQILIKIKKLNQKIIKRLSTAALCLVVSGCFGPGAAPGGNCGPAPPARQSQDPAPASQAELAAQLAKALGDPDLKMLFLGPARSAAVRYRYWTERRWQGSAGLVAVRGRGQGTIFGDGGAALAVYVLDHEGRLALATPRLEWTDVEPPLYILGVVDETKVGTWRSPRPLGLDRETEKRLKSFRTAPLDDLPFYQ
ncbi:MAG: hypothetical protein LBU12_03615 [Deltaproteobacteria bacterium]|nr:hypothetical protein [Deltaproteobacteria bacterium]